LRRICYYANVIGATGAGIEGTTEMTVTSIAADSPATRCAICAQPARSGSRLCAQCKAAVKRARQVPSLHPGFLPRTGSGTHGAGLDGGGDPHAVPARRAARAGLPPIPGGWGTYATLVAFGAAVSITGYFATGMQEEDSSRERNSAAPSVVSAVDTRSESGSHAQDPASSPAAGEPVPGTEVIAQIGWTAPPLPSVHAPAGSPARKPGRDAVSAGSGTPRAGSDARGMVAEPQPAQVAVADTGAAAPAPETQAAPTPDRWQLLAAAVARCERENVLVGLFCKERARLQYCEGQWGDAPQCPSVALSKNTR